MCTGIDAFLTPRLLTWTPPHIAVSGGPILQQVPCIRMHMYTLSGSANCDHAQSPGPEYAYCPALWKGSMPEAVLRTAASALSCAGACSWRCIVSNSTDEQTSCIFAGKGGYAKPFTTARLSGVASKYGCTHRGSLWIETPVMTRLQIHVICTAR